MSKEILDKLKVPGIGLIFTGVINGCLGALALISGLLRFSGIAGKEKLPIDEAERIGYLMGTFGGYGVGVLSLIVAPVIVFGGIKLIKGESRGLVIASAILSILPVTSCCFFIGIIFGVWTLVVLRNPDVKLLFQKGVSNAELYPPQPPQNW